MSIAQTAERDAALGVGIAGTVEDLSMIQRPDCAAAIWRRQLSPDFQTWINELDPEELPAARVTLPVDAVPAAVQDLCDTAGVEACAERAWLEQDIADLALHFATLMNAPCLQVRLDVVTTDACRKFHIDALTARLICTYRGTGTQYGVSADRELPKRVFTVGTGSPLILRGTLWPERPASGLLHRSPPISGTGETRLVLVLDPVFEPAEVR